MKTNLMSIRKYDRFGEQVTKNEKRAEQILPKEGK
jgi:hypothetical protein